MDDQLVRQKYVVTQICEHLGVSREEPAPLLNKTILDIGCGESVISENLVLRGADVTAIDVDEKSVNIKQQRSHSNGVPLVTTVASAEELIRQSITFDILLCLNVIDLIEHQDKFLWAARKLLKPNGILLYSTCNPSAVTWAAYKIFAERRLGIAPELLPRFNNCLTPAQLTAKLTANKFTPLHQQGYAYCIKENRWRKVPHMQFRYMGAAIRQQ